jgi:catechol 2,3-dioxygenase-like lactoylglutathione lyase family enzyme
MEASEPKSAAPARGIPSLRGHEHTGVTVPNLQQAIDFFVDVVACELITRFGPFRDDIGSFMADTLNVHPRRACALATRTHQLPFGHGLRGPRAQAALVTKGAGTLASRPSQAFARSPNRQQENPCPH